MKRLFSLQPLSKPYSPSCRMYPAVLLSKPEVSSPTEETKEGIGARLKNAMIAESSLIATNLKAFLASVALLAVGAAEMTAEPNSAEDYTLKGILIVAVIFLVRQIQVDRREHRAEVTKLWEKIERLGKKKNGDDDEDAPPTRRARP